MARLASIFTLAACTFTMGAAEPSKKTAEPTKVVITSVVFLTELNIAALTIDAPSLGPWAKPLIDGMDKRFQGELMQRTIEVQVTLRRQGPADIAVAGKPALSDDEKKAVLGLIDPAKAPQTKLVDCTFRVISKINGGHPDEKSPLTPPLKTPDEVRLAKFQAASTSDRLKLFRRWSRTEALPILVAAAASAEAKFEGVRNLGKKLGALTADGPIDVVSLTDKNPDYWRALLEMEPDNPFVPAVHVALLAANGEIDRARRILEIMPFVDANKSGFSWLLADFSRMAEVFIKDVEAKIGEGVALHDKGRFEEAIKAYDALLADYPKAAWAHYERFLTRREMAMRRGDSVEKAHADWPKAREAILASDPFYPMLARATGPDEVYHLARRAELPTLFKQGTDPGKELNRYAGIALDLGEYGSAGMLYWYAFILSKVDAMEGSKILEHFLYCLEPLGVKDLKANIRGDHEAEFAKIKAERLRLKTEFLKSQSEKKAKAQ